ncbi:Outer membrane efflux protein [Stieleria maiorica]|uniref:Outer membrane efflux protein n=1 Tax=Stieleria maiorica TaxID=2795974 RepID=A0A5B9MKI2_9BACT|nr:TolC family protein [Stieleria maiorica]QEG01414.1 Outer membrane efflux protein [Stieleria maiorica]
MTRNSTFFYSCSAIALLTLVGCATRVAVPSSAVSSLLAEVTIAQPSVDEIIQSDAQMSSNTPFSIRDSSLPAGTPPEPWDLTNDQAVQIALANSTVLRDLGARVIQTPGLTSTIYGPAIQTTDPTGGVEAALSEFDAQVNGDLFHEDNDRVLNNEFSGGGENFYQQQLTRLETSLSKQTVSGALFTLRHNFDADLNNSDRNLLDDTAWNWNFEGEVRHPLLQGRGVHFNRIAGPNATPGVYNGVVIARLNADVTVAQLEIALRDYLSDVENAYWDLYFAYADLKVKQQARDRSLNTYLLLKARQGLPGAEDDKLAQAKEQYFRFEQDVQNSLAGRLVVGTRTFNGSSGGTFQGTGGVYSNERRLRLIMGLPINDGRLIHPTSAPADAPVTYDWNDIVANAISRRTELRRQRLNVDRRRYELTASRNFLLPRLDAVGRYRYRALGESWFDHNITANGTPTSTGTHEWLMGLSLSYPVGFRQAHSAVRNAQLRLARERALLTELERQVVYGLSNAMAESDRAFAILRTALNRENAAREQYEILAGEAQAPVRQFDFNALLDSEQRYAEAASDANRARVQYALATKNLNFEMGALLEYFNIHLTETHASSSHHRSSAPGRQIVRSVVDLAKVPFGGDKQQGDAKPATPQPSEVIAVEESILGESEINAIIERELAGESSITRRNDPDVPVESPSDRTF